MLRRRVVSESEEECLNKFIRLMRSVPFRNVLIYATLLAVDEYSFFNKLETHKNPFRIKIKVNLWKCIHTTSLISSSCWQAV
jgi:hypothetical protein